MQRPKITVVTVCYNAVDTIENTILSVLNQTYDNIEYIIIDGSSTDGTVDIIKKYADKIAYWVSEPDNGIYDAMNKGIEIATGDYINFMNAGDRFASSTSIEGLVSRLKLETDVAYGDTIYDFHSEQLTRKPLSMTYLKSKPVFCHQSTLIKTSFHRDHPYNVNYKIAADYEFMYKSHYYWDAKFQYINKIISVFDCSTGTSTDNLRDSLNEKFRIWGIEHNKIRQIPYFLKLYRSLTAYKLKKIFSPKTVIRIKKIIDSLRSHQD